MMKIDSGKIITVIGAVLALGGFAQGYLQNKQLEELVDEKVTEKLSLINKEEA